LSLTALGNRSGTGFYTERLLEVLVSNPDRDFDLIPLLPKGLRADRLGDCPSGRIASSLRLRWPFRLGGNRVTGGLFRDLDLVHYPNGVGPPQSATPVVATIHDVSPFLCRETFPVVRSIYLRKALREVALAAKVVLTDSRWQEERLGHVFPACREKVRVVYPIADSLFGEDLPNSEPVADLPTDRVFLLMVGALEPRKRVAAVVEAWRRSDFDADLVLVGRWGWKNRRLSVTLDALGHKKRVKEGAVSWRLPDGRRLRHLGYVPKRQLAVCYRRAFCLVYASSFEGFGLPVLEAMMSGCPVVTRPDSAMEEVAQKAAWYFDPEGDPGSLGTVLRSMSLDPSQLRSRVMAGKARARDFNEKAFYSGVAAAYDAALR